MSQKLIDAGISLQHINIRSMLQLPMALWRLRKIVRELRPDVIQGWMYHGNIAALVARSGKQVAVVWNIRQSLHRRDLFKLTTRLMIRVNAVLSKKADTIIYNSHIARRQHEALGFCESIGVHIPNGIDLSRFSGGLEDRVRVRGELGITNNSKIVIAVGRVHPIKGHEVLLKAIELTLTTEPGTRFVIVGRGACWDQHPFHDVAANSLVRERTLLLGERDNIPGLLASADLFISASHTEGFPSAVAEAMAAGLPCVVTDVGDSRLLVGEHGCVVPANDANALGAAILDVLRLSDADRSRVGRLGRSIVEEKYSLPTVAKMYARLYRQVLNRTAKRFAA